MLPLLLRLNSATSPQQRRWDCGRFRSGAAHDRTATAAGRRLATTRALPLAMVRLPLPGLGSFDRLGMNSAVIRFVSGPQLRRARALVMPVLAPSPELVRLIS
jgi:hypothetical protein